MTAPAPGPVVVFAGVHGNEPSGMAALPELAAQGFVTFGPCNPWGHESGGRFTRRALDLNRSFARDDCEEAEAVRCFLADNRPGLVLDLHEDPQAEQPYLIQYAPEDSLGARIVGALRDDPCAFHPRPALAMIRGRHGVVRPTESELEKTMAAQGWSLGYYAWRTFGCVAVVVEAPKAWQLAAKRALHLRVCAVARDLFAVPASRST